jgi:hypothetical protein
MKYVQTCFVQRCFLINFDVHVHHRSLFFPCFLPEFDYNNVLLSTCGKSMTTLARYVHRIQVMVRQVTSTTKVTSTSKNALAKLVEFIIKVTARTRQGFPALRVVGCSGDRTSSFVWE